MNVSKIFAVLGVVLAVVLTPARTQAQNAARAEYLERYRDIATAHMEKYGIPASIKMAQGMLESGDGNGRLAREANNHFGIKCKNDWTGLTIHHDDDALQECFRRYDSAEHSWVDHSEYLDNNPRYDSLFALSPTDYRSWARALKNAGYATDPLYASKLVKIIEDHHLYLLDRGEHLDPGTILAHEPTREQTATVTTANAGEVDVDHYIVAMHHIDGRELYRTDEGLFVVARRGDTLHSLSELTGIRTGRLARLNHLKKSAGLTHGQHIKIG